MNTGDAANNLKVTKSRGYSRISYATDGGFESFNGDGKTSRWNLPILTRVTTGWISKSTVLSWIVYNPTGKYAHTGKASGLLGTGSLSAAKKLALTPGSKYIIQFFQNGSRTCLKQKNVSTAVTWNGAKACEAKVLSSGWKLYTCTVTAKGNDLLAFDSGNSILAWISLLKGSTPFRFIDDVKVFKAS